MNAKTIITVCLLLVNIAVQATGELPQVTPSSNSYQLKTENNKIPQGKWVLENVFAFEGNVQIQISAESFDFEIPTEMDVQQDELTFVNKGNTSRVEYDAVVKGNFLCFQVCAKWEIADNRLQLQWDQDIDGPADGPQARTIVLVYSQK